MGFGRGQVRLGGVGEALGKTSSVMILKTQMCGLRHVLNRSTSVFSSVRLL